MFELRARDAGVDLLSLRGQQLRLRGDDVGSGRRAHGILIARNLERALVLRDRIAQEIVQRVGFAQLEIGGRQRRLRGQRRIGEIGGAGLRAGGLAFDRAPHAAPEIERPTAAHFRAERSPERRGAGQGRVESERRKQLRAPLSDQRLSLAIIGFVRFQGLVGNRDLRLESVELGVAKQLPPRALGEFVTRGAELPSLDLLVLNRNDRRGPQIIRADARIPPSAARRSPPQRRGRKIRVSWPHSSDASARLPEVKPLPQAAQPAAEPVKIEINDRRRVEGQRLTDDKAPDD